MRGNPFWFEQPFWLEAEKACHVAMTGEYVALGFAALRPGQFVAVDVYLGQKLPVIQGTSGTKIVDCRQIVNKVDEEMKQRYHDGRVEPLANVITIAKKCILRHPRMGVPEQFHHNDRYDTIERHERDEFIANLIFTNPLGQLPRMRSDTIEHSTVDIYPLHPPSVEEDELVLSVVKSWRGDKTVPVNVLASDRDVLYPMEAWPEAA